MAVFSQTGGSNGGSYAQYFTLQLTVWEKPWDNSTNLPYSIAENKSRVGRKLELVSGQYGKFSQYYGYWSANVAEQPKSGEGYFEIMSAYTSLVLFEDEIVVEHDADGKKTINCSASLDMAGGTYSPRRFLCVWRFSFNNNTKGFKCYSNRCKYRQCINN